MAANTNHAFGYGDDPWTEEATRKVKEQFTHPCEPLFVFNGTGSNTMALQLMTPLSCYILCRHCTYCSRRVWSAKQGDRMLHAHYLHSRWKTDT